MQQPCNQAAVLEFESTTDCLTVCVPSAMSSDFAPLDSRTRALAGYEYDAQGRRGTARQAAVSDLGKTLVTDSYGPPETLKRVCWDAYNSRRLMQGC
eukprot:s2022_g6.t1